MTNINAILDRLADQHGNDWPEAAIERLLELHELTSVPGDGIDLYPEYAALKAWVKSTVVAGVAFKQKAPA